MSKESFHYMNADFIAGLQAAYHTISTSRTPHDAETQDDHVAISERRACMREIKAQIDALEPKPYPKSIAKILGVDSITHPNEKEA